MNPTPDLVKTQAVQWAETYQDLGWKVVPIPAGRKAPTHRGWQHEEACVVPQYWTGNLGLAHAYSGTCAIDIDNYDGAYWYLRELGVDLRALLSAPDAVQIASGKVNHYKLIYKLPAWSGPVRRKQVSSNGHAMIDFRCAAKSGLTVQDVLPPSIHPDTGQAYQWVGDWRNIPEIPGVLLNVWLQLLQQTRPVIQQANNHSEEELRSALFAIDPDLPRDEWVRVGMALHAADPEAVWLFDEWSATGQKYVGTDIGPVWDSFEVDESGITVATLFRYARDAGWNGHRPLLDEIFRASLQHPPRQSVGAAAVQHLPPALEESLYSRLERELKQLPPWVTGDEQQSRQLQDILLRSFELPVADQTSLHTFMQAHTGWTQTQLKDILRDLRKRQRALMAAAGDIERVLEDHIYVGKLHSFMHKESGEMYRPEAFIGMHGHLTEELRDQALAGNGCRKVTSIDFDPGAGEYFERDGAYYYNRWTGLASYGLVGDCTPWLRHLELLVPDAVERDHLLNWMAFTVQRPGVKINHAVVMTGAPGIGKDTLFWPLTRMLGGHAKQVGAEVLERDFNDWLCDTKLAIIQEPDYGSHREARRIANRMKNICSAPPDTLRVNSKGIPEFSIRNVISVVLLSNEDDPILVTDDDRRYFVMYSPLRVLDISGNSLPGWTEYFTDLWNWLRGGGGWQHVAAYLLMHDVSRFNPAQAPPLTDAKLDTIEATKSPLESLLYELYRNKIGPFAIELTTVGIIRGWMTQISGHNYCTMYGLRDVPSVVILGRALHSLLPLEKRRGVTVKGKRVKVLVLHNLEYWRQATTGYMAAYLEQHPVAKEYLN